MEIQWKQWKSSGWKINPNRDSGNPVETVEIQWMKYLANGNPNRDSGNPVETVEIQWMEIKSIDCHI